MAQQRPAVLRSCLASSALIALLTGSVLLLSHGQDLQSSSQTVYSNEASRASFRQSSDSTESAVVAQTDGEADAVKSYQFTLPAPLVVADVEFVQTSSNKQVLLIEDNQNMLISTSQNGQSANVTVSHSFDRMVGETDYTLTCRRKDNEEVVYTSTQHYTVCGVSFYRMNDESPTVVSGVQAQYSISYQNAIDAPYDAANEIHVLVQYPDGRTSEGYPSGSLPKQSGLSISTVEFRSQFVHNAVSCDMAQVGSYRKSSGLTLPDGCGYGLYRNEKGELCFGILYTPYRAGGMEFDISWDTLVDTVPTLAEDGYSEKLQASVTGLPPIVVTKMEPEDFLFRPEGGQTMTLHFFNGDLRASSTRKVDIENTTKPCSELTASYDDSGAPRYTQTATYITESGEGSDLPCTFEYTSTAFGGESTYQIAKVANDVDFTVTYDTNPILIDSISPIMGLEAGGEPVTVKGYFQGFDSSVDGVFFNGARLPSKYYTSESEAEIVFTLPPRTEIGEGYDYNVDVRIGNAISDSVEFQYTITEASVVISQSGTTRLLGDDVFRLGDCAPGRMTAVVSPFTNQVQSYAWSLTSLADDKTELMGTLQNPSVDGTTQTLEIEPTHLDVGEEYKLEVKVLMPGTTALTSISLIRENSVTIGAYILEPPARSVAFPETPLRLSAIVRTPNTGCYNGTNGLVFQWAGFGQTQRYSPENATGEGSATAEIVLTPARLGWEFLVPQSQLSVGEHDVTFKAWMESNPLVAGSATRIVKILHAPLQAVIRGGESKLTLNRNTDVEMTGANSVDPDQAFSSAASPLTYQWSCLETTGAIDFSVESTVSACDSGFLPDGTQAETFTVRKELLSALPEDVKALQFQLKVQSDDRVSQPSKLTLTMTTGSSTQSHLTGYTIQLQDDDNSAQDINNVKYYQAVVVDVGSEGEDVSWTYEIVEPVRQNVLTSTNLIQTPVYFSPDSTGTGGNRKPLGIEASKLNPGTTYTLKVSFTGSASYEDTDAFLTFKTSAEPALNFPEPTIMNGTTLTQYTATAGITQNDFEYTYYFILEDDTGREYCVGGCTGYGIIYFRIGRPGSYKLSVLLYDSQGKALLHRATLSNPIVVREAETDHDLYSELGILFANGDDSSWTQLAYDLATLLLENEQPAGNTTEEAFRDGAETRVVVRTLPASNYDVERQAVSDEDKLATLGDGLRKIMCASRPSSGHGALAIDVVTKLSALPSITRSTFYDITGTVSCSVDNTPKGTALTFKLEDLLQHLRRHVTTGGDESGSGRRRLLQTDESLPPANLRADLNCWSGKMITASTTSSESEGFSTKLMNGSFAVAKVANTVQLPLLEINGELQNGIEAGSEEEGYIFYTKGDCSTALFSANGDQRRFISVQATTNFVTQDRFQKSPPPGGYLSDSMFLTQVFKEDKFGRIVEMTIAERQDIDPCYCHKLPIRRNLDELNEQIGSSPNMFTLTDKKPFQKDGNKSGQFFNYVVDEGETQSYNIRADGSESWAEVCSRGVGFAGSTIATRAGQNIGGKVDLIGKSSLLIMSSMLAGLIVVVVAIVASWVVATKTMAAGAPTTEALEAHELYVERDIYGRGTIFGPNKGAAAKAAVITAAGLE